VMQGRLSSGDQVLHYRIARKIGEGGMGVVFEAEDERLNRKVAIKVLQPSISQDVDARERFLREARAASAIDHPNLCTIYAVEEAADGSLLLVMAYYQGKTLAELLQSGPVDLLHLRSIGTQAASGLHAAHMAGIVHRDIKPGNIFLLHSGTVKILDFGLSRIAHLQQLTAPHSVMGTLAYMPPEQLSGEQVDHRADIWALGAVLYEMAVGHSPFAQATRSATMAAISASRYIPLKHARPDLPASIHAAVERALRVQPHERHSSAAELLSLLHEDAPHPSSSRSSYTRLDAETEELPAQRPSISSRAAYSSALSTPSSRQTLSIAVLPMQNLSSDPENEYFADGLTDELISSLGMLPGLRVVSRSSAFAFKGKPQNIREIGKALDVSVILEGSVRRSTARIRVNMQLSDVEQGFQTWSSRFESEISEVFELQDELAGSVVSALQQRLAPNLHPSDLPVRTPMETGAYEAYLKGRYHWEQKTIENIQLAGRYFEQALKLDPGSAIAYAGVADFYCLQGTLGLMPPQEAWPIARSSALQAIALDPNLPEGHLSLAAVLQFYDWNWSEAREHIEKAIALRPHRGESYFLYISHLMTQGLLEEALKQTRIGLTYDPLATPLLAAEAMLRTYLGDHDSSILLASSALHVSPHYFELYYALGLAQSLTGRSQEAVATFERGLEHSRMPILLGWLAEAHVRNGDKEKACKALNDLLEMAKQGSPMPVAIAVAAASLEEFDLAFEWLEKAAERRDIFLGYVTVLPSLRALHDDQRYHGLLQRMKLAHPSTHRRRHEARTGAVEARS
jgi:serine/threonine protein kinase/tetratricopeptide (TPR) repeat protein